MTIAEVRRRLKDSLVSKYGEREATAMARMVIMSLKGWDMPGMLANEDREASDYILNKSEEILNLLLKDMPLQYALGEASFYGMKLTVNPAVLIPRPETEELVDLIVGENRMSDLQVLDIGTGSGAIAIALSRNLPFSQVDAVDVSAKALSVAKENAVRLKARISFILADIFNWDEKDKKYDIIVSNPPYVDESEKAEMEPNVLKYEPSEALYVPDDDPLVFYKRICQVALECLVPGGKIYFEINPRHSVDIRRLLSSKGFENIDIIKDVHGKERFARATLKTRNN